MALHSLAPTNPDFVCIACQGLLQSKALFGSVCGADGVKTIENELKGAQDCGHKDASMAKTNALCRQSDWPVSLTQTILNSGYDLHGSISVSVTMSQRTVAGDGAVRARVSEVLAAAAADVAAGRPRAHLPQYGGTLPSTYWPLKDVVRSLAVAAITSVHVGPMLRPPPPGPADSGHASSSSSTGMGATALPATSNARVVSTVEYAAMAGRSLRHTASCNSAAGVQGSGSSSSGDGATGGAAAAAAGVPSSSSSAASSLEDVWVDLGSGMLGKGSDSTYADWDAETHAPAAEALAEWKRAAVAALPPGFSRLRVWQQSSLQLTLAVVPPSTAESAALTRALDVRAAAAKAALRAPEPSSGEAGEASAQQPSAAPAPAPPALPTVAPCRLASLLSRGPLLVTCRYNKYARGLSQSKWVLEGRRLGSFPSSVEELTAGTISGSVANPALAPIPAAAACPLRMMGSGAPVAPSDVLLAPPVTSAPSGVSPLAQVPGVTYKFHSAGREDVDVRMLGPGRPCMAELLDARPVIVHASLFPALEALVNAQVWPAPGLVAVRGVGPGTREEFAALQAGADSKRKRYAAEVWVSAPHSESQLRAVLEGLVDVAITQRTPLRVLHRRSLLARVKTMHDMRVTAWRDPHHFTLELTSSAGEW